MSGETFVIMCKWRKITAHKLSHTGYYLISFKKQAQLYIFKKFIFKQTLYLWCHITAEGEM